MKLSTDRFLKTETMSTDEITENQVAIKETVDASEEEQEKDEDTITVTALGNEEEISENLAEQEKKKHTLFY